MPDGPFRNFGEFHTFLDANDELRRVSAAVDPVLELAEVSDRVMKSVAPHGPAVTGDLDKHVHADKGGRALIFDNVAGSDIPVAINTFGSYWRITRALGTDNLEDLAARIGKFVKPVPPPTLAGKVKFAAEAAGDLKGVLLPSMSKFLPSILRGGAPCQEVVWTDDQIDLDKLPIIQCWPHDGDLESGQVFSHLKGEVGRRKGEVRTGKYITLAGVYTKNPDDGDTNVGMYRVQKFDKKTCAMHWHMHHDGARHYRMYQKRGERCPLAIVLGGPSVMPYSATAPLPPGIPELLFAGFVNRSPIEMVRCKTIDLEVPAEAEIVIEGHVHPTDTLLEGPFGDHTGFYSLADMYPKFEVSAITMRREPVYPTT
ncbi:MAG: UbiD family decarboxylase domain-containing protein, partial [Planctomycetota bacterium]